MKLKEATPFIQLKQVTKEYKSAGKSFKALTQADLTIHRGEYVGILGKSGSGKTTLMNMITGIDKPSSGEILIDGAAIHQMSENQTASWRNQHVGIVFQFFQLLPTLTVLENVMIPMDFSGKVNYNDKKKRAINLLERVGIGDQAPKFPSALSGGQQQRVAIARALANDPSIILADEPTGNLDSHFAEIIFNTFDALVDEGKTVILVSHDAEIKKRISRAILITDGILTDDQLFDNTMNHREAALC